ncbi:MAG: hypothetical protein CL842_03990 [Crocinitomicaceae bacterium]|nr:hypothetical protein [Crocinitomicaceae bacterium]|tara:strand:+ start:55 stop:516 length:462 start_codon:yes stop_codon:yes gene_type:complete
MNNNIFYLLLIGLLLISNLATLFFVMQKGKHKPFHDGPKSIIIEKLAFDEDQTLAYEKLIDQHRTNIKTCDKKIIQLKKELYSLLQTQSNEQYVDSLTSEISFIQKQIETIHFHHFNDIKSLCKPEQISNFNVLVGELEILFNKKSLPKKQNK